MNKRILIGLLFLSACGSPVYVQTYIIDTSCDMSIVEGELNGKKTYFLLDTGAGLTTFDLNQAKLFGFSSEDSDQEVGGFNNDKSKIKRAVGIRSIRINGMELSGDINYTNNMNNLVRFIESCAHKTISGIIGAPIIRRHGLVIDLTNGRLFRVQ